jgi:hypothetical protein
LTADGIIVKLVWQVVYGSAVPPVAGAPAALCLWEQLLDDSVEPSCGEEL